MNFKMKPMDHQQRHYDLTCTKRYYGNVADMGTGKSKMFVDVASYLYLMGKVDAWLILGNSGSYETWITEHLPQHVPDEVHYEVRKWSSKLTGKKLKDFEDFIQLRHEVPGLNNLLLIVVANVEALAYPRSFQYLYDFARVHRTITVIDESSTIRNPKAARTKGAWKLRDVSVGRRFLTGSPIDNRPLDLWAQLEFLSPGLSGYRSFYSFKNQFADLQPIYVKLSDRQRIINLKRLRVLESRVNAKTDDVGRNIFRQVKERFVHYNFQLLRSLLPDLERHLSDTYLIDQLYQLCLGRVNKVAGYRNLDELRSIINRTCFVVKSEDCLDLPEKVYQTYHVELTDEQRRIYREIKENSIAFLNQREEHEGVVTVNMVLTRMLRLHQIVCGFVKDDDDVEHDVPSRRVDALLDLSRECARSALIFCNFNHSIHDVAAAFREEYGDDAVALYYGETDHDHRRVAIHGVQSGRVRWLVTNQTGAYGLNLPQLDAMFFFGNVLNAEVRNQVEKRIHRIGRERSRSALYVDLVARGTVDEKILQILRDKKAMSDSLIVSNWRELIV